MDLPIEMLTSKTEKNYTLCIVCRKDISSSAIVRLSALHNIELLDIKPYEEGKDYALYLNIAGMERRQMPILFVLSETECRVVANTGDLSEVQTLLSLSGGLVPGAGNKVG
jgi:hypothetical protein